MNSKFGWFLIVLAVAGLFITIALTIKTASVEEPEQSSEISSPSPVVSETNKLPKPRPGGPVAVVWDPKDLDMKVASVAGHVDHWKKMSKKSHKE